ncbi:hypothetical protein DRO54_05530 [Candidatus Bathyarchaeota archaeon]|nr:MAG: hypothetical protein DRO54_05530 [Candidatus Bathyarchaeota archaeon]
MRKYRILKENAVKDNSRIDFLLGRNGQRFYLEVKSVSYVIDKVALFPDAPTLRGRKHLEALIKCRREGFNAGILFNVQRPDAEILRPCHEIDSKFSELIKKAVENGVKVFTQTLIFHPMDTVEVIFHKPVFSLS